MSSCLTFSFSAWSWRGYAGRCWIRFAPRKMGILMPVVASPSDFP